MSFASFDNTTGGSGDDYTPPPPPDLGLDSVDTGKDWGGGQGSDPTLDVAHQVDTAYDDASTNSYGTERKRNQYESDPTFDVAHAVDNASPPDYTQYGAATAESGYNEPPTATAEPKDPTLDVAHAVDDGSDQSNLDQAANPIPAHQPEYAQGENIPSDSLDATGQAASDYYSNKTPETAAAYQDQYRPANRAEQSQSVEDSLKYVPSEATMQDAYASDVGNMEQAAQDQPPQPLQGPGVPRSVTDSQADLAQYGEVGQPRAYYQVQDAPGTYAGQWIPVGDDPTQLASVQQRANLPESDPNKVRVVSASTFGVDGPPQPDAVPVTHLEDLSKIATIAGLGSLALSPIAIPLALTAPEILATPLAVSAFGGTAAAGAYLTKGTGETTGQTGLLGTGPGKFIQNILENVPLYGKYQQAFDRIPIPEVAQNPLALLESAVQAFIDQPSRLLNPVLLAGDIYKNGLVDGGLGNAFRQSDQTFALQSGLQKAGAEYLATSIIALHGDRGLGGVISLANPINDYRTIFQGELDRLGRTPADAAAAAFARTNNGVADVLRTFDVFNPLVYAVEMPGFEGLVKGIFSGGGTAVRAFLNSAETFGGGNIAGAGVRSAGYAANKTLDLFTELSRTSAANLLTNDLRNDLWVALGRNDQMHVPLADLTEAFLYKGQGDAATQRLATFAQDYLGGTSPDLIAKATSLSDRLGNGFTARMVEAGVNPDAIPALLEKQANLFRSGLTDGANQATSAALDATARQYNLLRTDPNLRSIATFELAMKDIQASVYRQAGLPTFYDPGLLRQVLEAGTGTMRTMFLLPGAVALSGKKIVDEFLRGGLQGVVGLRPADFQLIRTGARLLAERAPEGSLLRTAGRSVYEQSVVQRMLREGTPIGTGFLRDTRNPVNLGTTFSGRLTTGEQANLGQRVSGILGAPQRAADKLLQTLVTSPTQHLRYNAASRALGGSRDATESLVVDTARGLQQYGMDPRIARATAERLYGATSPQDFFETARMFREVAGPVVPERGIAQGRAASPRVMQDIGRTEPGLLREVQTSPFDYTRRNPDLPINPATGKAPLPREIAPEKIAAGQEGPVPLNRREQANDTMARIKEAGGDLRAVTKEEYQQARQFLAPAKDMGDVSKGGTFGPRGNRSTTVREIAGLEYDDAVKAGAAAPNRAQEWADAMASGKGAGFTVPQDVRRAAAEMGVPYDPSLTPQQFAERIRGGSGGGIDLAAGGDGGAGYLSRQQRTIRDNAQEFGDFRTRDQRQGPRGTADAARYDRQGKIAQELRDAITDGTIDAKVAAAWDDPAELSRLREGTYFGGGQHAAELRESGATDTAMRDKLAQLRDTLKARSDALEAGPVRRGVSEPVIGSGNVGEPVGRPRFNASDRHDFIPPGAEVDPTLAVASNNPRATGPSFGMSDAGIPRGSTAGIMHGTPIAPTPPGPTPPDFQGAADFIAAQGRTFGEMQRGRGTAAVERGNKIVGNFAEQTPMGELMAKGTINGKGPGIAVLPFSAFHVHTTQYWAEYFLQHPQAAFAVANALNQYNVDEYGAKQIGGKRVEGLLELSTAAKLVHWAQEMYQYATDAIRNPNGNNPLQTAAKIIGYGTVGNNAYVNPFPQFSGFGQGIVQSTTNPMLTGKTDFRTGKPIIDPREVMKEQGAGSPLTGAAQLVNARFGGPVPRNVIAGGTNPGQGVSNLARSGAVNLVNLLGGDANVKPYQYESGLPYMAQNFGGARGWDTKRTNDAVTDAMTKHPQTADGKALLSEYQYQGDLRDLWKTSPVRVSEESGAPLYGTPMTSFEHLDYAQRAGQGGKDAGTGQISKAGNFYLESPEQRAQATARAEISAKTPVTPESVPFMDYARDYLQRTGNTFLPGRTETGALAKRSDAIYQNALDANAKRTGAGLPQEQRIAQIAKEGQLQTPIGNGQTAQDLLRQPGNYYDTLDKITAAKNAGDTDLARRLEGTLAGIRDADTKQVPALADYFKGLKDASTARIEAAGGTPQEQFYHGLTQPEKDAYDAFNDLKASADYKRLAQLEKDQAAAGPYKSAGEAAWYKQNGTELNRLKAVRDGAEQSIVDRFGTNPKEVANRAAIAAGYNPPYADTTIKGATPTPQSPTSSKSGGSSYQTPRSSGGSGTSGRTSNATFQANQKAGNDFFDFYKGLTDKGERAAVQKALDASGFNPFGEKGVTAAAYGRALEVARKAVASERVRGALGGAGSELGNKYGTIDKNPMTRERALALISQYEGAGSSARTQPAAAAPRTTTRTYSVPYPGKKPHAPAA